MSVPLSVLRRNYNAIIFAYGAAKDRPLHIPGETSLLGVYSARQFVGWYNGHPDHASLEPNLSGHDSVIIGHGNVSLDVARIILADVDDLRNTDISEQALAQLCSSRIKHVRIVGRRGPVQASFAVKEFRELLKRPITSLGPEIKTLTPGDISGLPRPSRRLIETMSSAVAGCPRSSASRSWSLDFCLSPKRFIGSRLAGASHPQIGFTIFEKMRLLDASQISSKIDSQGETICYPSQTVFKSVGYEIKLIEGLSQCGASLDKRTGALRHDGNGRLISRDSSTALPPAGKSNWLPPQTSSPAYQTLPGLYCSGWAKQGPTGVIASTMLGGYETADTLCQDWQAGRPFLETHLCPDVQASPHGTLSHDSTGNETRFGWEGVKRDEDVINVSTAKVMMWEDWQRLNEIEIMRGRPHGKPREKFVTRSELLQHLE
jgi:adrenodoxin-NADP+ reductase